MSVAPVPISRAAAAADEVILRTDELRTYFKAGRAGVVRAVEGVNFSLRRGKVLGIIGESGSGKSVTARSILRIIEPPGYIAGGRVLFKGEDILQIPEKRMRTIRGNEISMIFQDPTTSLNPYMTIGGQLTEAYNSHTPSGSEKARDEAVRVLKLVGINNGGEIMKKYPCQFSAGFRQRIFIAMSMILYPDVLIADEPTTSLGITIQAEIIEALSEVQRQTGISIIIITHDFGVAAQFSDDIFVMYAGRCVEFSPKRDLLTRPAHPYTIGLIRSVPLLEERKTRRLKSIPGFPPDMSALPPGCPFAERCEFVGEPCREEMPELRAVSGAHLCACHYPQQYNVSEDTELGVF
ncbi:MAG: ABC transporter ATP-binding protein [Gracilibacteraceae bacterium]|jgi:oligopeptide/dipeptide ABC transporter ATP-binding protein|nr:ABC transporter ATP-binding protein [Gracilibacteraceae bacterium]